MAPPPVPASGSRQMQLLNRATALHVAIYRLTRGKLLGRFGKAPILLLHHRGRKSGQDRLTPLLYAQDGANLAIVGSAGGRDQPPAWWVNLRAAPETLVEVGGAKRRVRAREAEGEERERLWRRAAEAYPDYDVYQGRTERRIPVIVLDPA